MKDNRIYAFEDALGVSFFSLSEMEDYLNEMLEECMIDTNDTTEALEVLDESCNGLISKTCRVIYEEGCPSLEVA